MWIYIFCALTSELFKLTGLNFSMNVQKSARIQISFMKYNTFYYSLAFIFLLLYSSFVLLQTVRASSYILVHIHTSLCYAIYFSFSSILFSTLLIFERKNHLKSLNSKHFNKSLWLQFAYLVCLELSLNIENMEFWLWKGHHM